MSGGLLSLGFCSIVGVASVLPTAAIHKSEDYTSGPEWVIAIATHDLTQHLSVQALDRVPNPLPKPDWILSGAAARHAERLASAIPKPRRRPDGRTAALGIRVIGLAELESVSAERPLMIKQIADKETDSDTYSGALRTKETRSEDFGPAVILRTSRDSFPGQGAAPVPISVTDVTTGDPGAQQTTNIDVDFGVGVQ